MVSNSESADEPFHMVFERLYTAITYALLQFAHNTLQNLLPSAMAIIVLCILSSVLFVAKVLLESPEDSALVLLRQFTLLTLAQTGINLAAADFSMHASSPIVLRTESVAATTMLLMMVNAVTHVVHTSPVLSRSVTLLLYMYTDTLETLLHSLTLGAVSNVVAVLVYLLLSVVQMQVSRGYGFIIIVRGMSMVCINVLLRTISSEACDLHTKAGLLLFFLFFSDFAIKLLSFLEEVRGYILWKTAQIVYVEILQLVGDVYAGMLLGLILALLRGMLPGSWPQTLTTALQLSALVVVNMVLGPLNSILSQMQSFENVIIAFNMVILVHSLVYGLLAKKEAPPS